MKHFVFAMGVLGIILGATKPAAAGSVTYTETFTGSGTLNGHTFTNATVVLSGTGDTADIQEFGSIIFVNDQIAMSATIGLTTFSFTDSFNVFLNQANSPSAAFGFQDNNFEPELASADSSAFSSYDLSGPLSPVITSTGVGIDEFDTYSTSDGSLQFTSFSGPATVTATSAGAVPEPSSFVLAAIGIAAVTGDQFRRRKLARA